MDVSELLKRYEAGERDFSGSNLILLEPTYRQQISVGHRSKAQISKERSCIEPILVMPKSMRQC
jgi:hypothetical protein